MKFLVILLALYLVNAGIVSRNGRIQDMVTKIHAADALYDELIGKAEEKI